MRRIRRGMIIASVVSRVRSDRVARRRVRRAAGVVIAVLFMLAAAGAGSDSALAASRWAIQTTVTGAEARTVPALTSSSSWVVAKTPQPKGGGGLAGVSCPTVTMCLAVGYHNAGAFTEPDGTLAEAWNGSAWKIQTTPNPAGFADGQFNKVSCSSATFCMAVGFAHSPPDTYRTLAEAWNGSTWTIEPTPTPGAGGHLDSVSCTSATNCIAGGLSSDGQLAEHWNGSNWTVMTQTELPAADLGGVSCTKATSCTAVGIQLVSIDGSGYWRTLAEHWNGTTWAIETTPNPGGGDQTTFDAVSCTQTSFCAAVGSDADKSGQTQYAFSATWNGSTWTAENAPYRPGTNGDYLTGVTCISTNNCIAAGNTQTVNSVYATLVDQWNGSAWTMLPAPPFPPAPPTSKSGPPPAPARRLAPRSAAISARKAVA